MHYVYTYIKICRTLLPLEIYCKSSYDLSTQAFGTPCRIVCLLTAWTLRFGICFSTLIAIAMVCIRTHLKVWCSVKTMNVDTYLYLCKTSSLSLYRRRPSPKRSGVWFLAGRERAVILTLFLKQKAASIADAMLVNVKCYEEDTLPSNNPFDIWVYILHT